MELLLKGVAIGIGATVLMDLWAVFLWKVFRQARPNWGPVGRCCGGRSPPPQPSSPRS